MRKYCEKFSLRIASNFGNCAQEQNYHADMCADTVVYRAITSKQSAQRLVAALAEQEVRLDGCEVTAFRRPILPGLEVER
jgi:hypothetical protein